MNKDTNLFEWKASRMRNYMIKIMMKDDTKTFKPGYYKPYADTPKVVTGYHVTQLYGVFLGRMLSGNKSVSVMY